MMIFDAHCHIGVGRLKQQTTEVLLNNMDENGISRAVVVPVEEYLSVYNEEGNAYILEQTRLHPDRLFGFAVANPWYGLKACDMLERYLEEGLVGIKFNSTVQGFKINEDIVFPLIEIAARRSVPVYFHTGTPITAMPFQLYDLARRYPEVNFIMGHCGWSDFWQDMQYIASHSENIWFETSLSYTSRTESLLPETCGCQRIIFGSDSPHSNAGLEIKKVLMTQVNDNMHKKILSGNIRFLLGR